MWHSRPGWGSLVRLMYRRNLPHIQVDDTPHFVTFRTHKDFVLPLAFTIASGDPSLDKTSLVPLSRRHRVRDSGTKSDFHPKVFEISYLP
jgi:hypothetical protein